MSLQLCPLCESVLYRVEPENGSFVAYDQESGAVVPIPEVVLASYEQANVRIGTTYACRNGFPISYRCTVPMSGPRSSRVGARHITENP